MPNPDPNFTRTPHSQPSHLNALTSTYNQAAVYGPPGSAARLLLGEVLPLPGFDASPNTPQRAAAEARAAAAMARGSPATPPKGAAASRFGSLPKGGQVRRRQTLGGAGTVSKQFVVAVRQLVSELENTQVTPLTLTRTRTRTRTLTRRVRWLPS